MIFAKVRELVGVYDLVASRYSLGTFDNWRYDNVTGLLVSLVEAACTPALS